MGLGVEDVLAEWDHVVGREEQVEVLQGLGQPEGLRQQRGQLPRARARVRRTDAASEREREREQRDSTRSQLGWRAGGRAEC